MTARLSSQAEANVLAASIVQATAPARRSIWEPSRDPLTARENIAMAIITVAALGTLAFFWVGTP